MATAAALSPFDDPGMRSEIRKRLLLNKYIPHFPHPKQAYALLLPHLEVFFGGAGGGGKSDWLLMGALQYVHIPGYSAILFRRTYPELAKPEALMDRAHSWLRRHTDARWSSLEHAYKFPKGSQIIFSHLENENSVYEHQSAAYQYIGFDELTTFTERMYRFLFSRLRRLLGMVVPLRMRSASNPGGVGHDWVKQRFMLDKDPARAFIPAKMTDNPYLDTEQYAIALAQLDPVTRQQIQDGNWDVLAEGNLFKRVWFAIKRDYPRGSDNRVVRYWDFAGTEAKKQRGLQSNDPDWCVGTKITEVAGQYWIIDMQRDRLRPKGVEDLIVQTAQLDGPEVEIWLEQEPGSSGKAVIEDYQQRVLVGYGVYGHHPTGNKIVRARPMSAAAEAKNVFLVEGHWNSAFLDEVPLFGTPGIHDDIVDTLSGGHHALTHKRTEKVAGVW